MTERHNWQPIVDAGGWLAPEAEEVWTKIDDEHGARNVVRLTRYGNLWWTDPDRSKGMYVYYTPTHWRQNMTTKTDPLAPHLLALEERDKRYTEEIASLKAQLAEANREIERLKATTRIRSYNPNSYM